MKAWTDYPIIALGDAAGELAPVRECTLVAYDGDKYCEILVEGVREHLKACYVYRAEGRAGTVSPVPRRLLLLLKKITYGEPISAG